MRGRYCKSGGQSHICTNQQLTAAKTKVVETVGCRSGTYSFLQQASTPLGHRTCSSLPVVDEWLQRQAGQLLTDKHVVFIGSSVARYQYLNLAHHLLLGRAPSYTLTDKGLELLAAMNITNRPTKAGNYESYWAQWNLASNRLLNQGEGGSEVCDCFRGLPSSANNDLVSEKQMHNVDMRYATSHRHRAALTYVQVYATALPPLPCLPPHTRTRASHAGIRTLPHLCVHHCTVVHERNSLPWTLAPGVGIPDPRELRAGRMRPTIPLATGRPKRRAA